MILYRSAKAHLSPELIWLGRSKFDLLEKEDEVSLEAVTSFALRDLAAPFTVWVKLRSDEDPSLFVDATEVELAGKKPAGAGAVWRRSGPVSIGEGAAAVHRVKIGPLRSKAGCAAVVLSNDAAFVPPNGEAQFEKGVYGVKRADLGTSELSPARTLIRAAEVFRLRYTVGKAGIAVGGGIAIGIPWGLFPAPVWPGVESVALDDPAADRAPLQIVSPNAKDLALLLEDRREVWFATREYLVRVEATRRALNPGDVIELQYGDDDRKAAHQQSFPCHYTGVEKDCWYTPTVPLRVLVDPSGSGQYVPILEENSHRLSVLPGRATRLHVTVPSLAAKGRPIALRMAFTNDDNSPPETPVDGMIGGVRFKDSVATAGISLSVGGRLQIKAETAQATILGVSNPVEVIPRRAQIDLYWGEIHGHCGLCDGLGSPEQYFEHARNVAHLDFTSLTSHAPYLSDCAWQRIQEVTNSVHVAGKFATILGYEWSGAGGHRNVYTSSPELDILRENDGVRGLDDLWKALEGRSDLLVVPHHTLPFGRLEPHRPDLEKLIEIYSMWGCSEHVKNPMSDKPDHGTSVQDALAEGKRLGIIAGSDNHDGRPGCSGERPGTKSRYGNLTFKAGLTAVYAEQLSRQAIFGALCKRRCYGTTGARIIVDFKVNDRWMGEEIPAANPRRVTASVVGVEKIERIEVIRNNQTAHTHRPEGSAAQLQWDDESPWEDVAIRRPGMAPFLFYYLRVVQADGETAWTSPVWLSGG